MAVKKRNRVYRQRLYLLNNGETELAGKQATNLPGVVYSLERAIYTQKDTGNTIGIFKTRIEGPFKANSDLSDLEGHVNKEIKAKYGPVCIESYSFPRGGKWEADYLGSIKVTDFEKFLTDYAVNEKQGVKKFFDLSFKIEMLRKLVNQQFPRR